MNLYTLIFISILCWGVGSFFYKGANQHMHPIMVACIATCVYICILPLYVIFFNFDKKYNMTGIAYNIAGALCMCIGSIAYFFALRKGYAGQVTALTALHPVITLTLSILIMKEPITYPKVIGMLLALVSAYILSL